MPTRPTIACLIYDFDKTLSPRDMQEYAFLPGLGIAPDDFWAECRECAVKNGMDSVLVYMYKMVEKARESGNHITREVLNRQGESIEFFPGVESWFHRVNARGAELGMQVEHYIISSGLKEIIEGSRISKYFKAIFAASFCYGEDGQAVWPATAVNYTSKTQHMFRINKGILDVTNHVDLNNFTPEELRPIPFPNMIYLGDGLTDVPCMKLAKSKGGTSIVVHPPGETSLGDDMLIQNRVDYSIEADYSRGSDMEAIVFALLGRIAAQNECARIHNAHMALARRRR